LKRLKTSIVAWSGAAALASFAILYQIIPYERLLDTALSLAFGVSLATVIRYSIDAFKAIRSGRVGAEFLIVAVFSMVLLILIQRTWGIILRVYNRPDWLVNSPMTIFIPWMLAWAVSLALVAPDIAGTGSGSSKPGLWRSIALFVAGALAGFVLSTSFRAETSNEISTISAWPHLANRAVCPSDQPVWGSERGVYHVEDSPYRGMVIPDWCFSSSSEAERKGFRAPIGLKPAD
jgi:hypothetical protein